MKILSRNAASHLFMKLDSLHDYHESWRCIHLNPNNSSGLHNRGLVKYFYVKPIINLLEAHDGYIYLCEDGDIFILFQGSAKAMVKLLENHFGDMGIKEPAADPQENLFTMYDLSLHWKEFFALSRSRVIRTNTPKFAPTTQHYFGATT